MAQFFRRVLQTLLYTNAPPDEQRAFLEHTHATTARTARGFAALAILATLLWWPLDFVLYANAPAVLHAMSLWRTGNLIAMSLVWLSPWYWPSFTKQPVPIIAACGAAGAALATWVCGQVAPLDPVWFGIAYVLPMTTIAFVVSLPARVLITALFGFASWGGYFLGNPVHLRAERYSGATISYMLIVVVSSIAAGHLSFHFLRAGFVAQRRLSAMKEQLEDHVRAQTADLRQLTGRIETLREEERQEIAHDLQDALGRQLSAIEFEVGVLDETARLQGVQLDLKQIHALVEEMRDTFGRVLGTLRPRALETGGLVPALANLVREHQQANETPVTLTVEPPDLAIDGELSAAAYRIVQEALTNVVRHAHATRVELGLTLLAGQLHVSVRDDGVGVADAPQWRREAVGVSGMRERARMLGGELLIGRDPRGGTRVTLVAPLVPTPLRVSA